MMQKKPKFRVNQNSFSKYNHNDENIFAASVLHLFSLVRKYVRYFRYVFQNMFDSVSGATRTDLPFQAHGISGAPSQ